MGGNTKGRRWPAGQCWDYLSHENAVFSVEVAVDTSRGYSLDSRLRNPRWGKRGAGTAPGEERGAAPGVGARAPGREYRRGTGAGRRRLGAIRPRAGSSPRNRPPTAARGSRLPTPEPRRRLSSPLAPRHRGGPEPGPDAWVGPGEPGEVGTKAGTCKRQGARVGKLQLSSLPRDFDSSSKAEGPDFPRKYFKKREKTSLFLGEGRTEPQEDRCAYVAH